MRASASRVAAAVGFTHEVGLRSWVGVSDFGRIRLRVGFRRFRVDSQQPFRDCFCGILQSVWAFDPIDSRFGRIPSRVRLGRIQADSWTPETESANPATEGICLNKYDSPLG